MVAHLAAHRNLTRAERPDQGSGNRRRSWRLGNVRRLLTAASAILREPPWAAPGHFCEPALVREALPSAAGRLTGGIWLRKGRTPEHDSAG